MYATIIKWLTLQDYLRYGILKIFLLSTKPALGNREPLSIY